MLCSTLSEGDTLASSQHWDGRRVMETLKGFLNFLCPSLHAMPLLTGAWCQSQVDSNSGFCRSILYPFLARLVDLISGSTGGHVSGPKPS